MDNNLEELKNIKISLEELSQLTKAEQLMKPKGYGDWIKYVKNEEISYSRSDKVGNTETITTTTPDIDIEKTILKQKKGRELTEYFCNTKPEELTNENILFFLANTTDYQSYLDINKIINKIVSINKEYKVHNDYEENLIFNSVLALQKIGEIPEQLFKQINEYLPPLEEDNNVSRRAA